jgi:hypothetical protein
MRTKFPSYVSGSSSRLAPYRASTASTTPVRAATTGIPSGIAISTAYQVALVKCVVILPPGAWVSMKESPSAQGRR